MSSRPTISVRGLGKRYRLGQTLSKHTLRDALANGASRLVGRSSGGRRRAERDLWALKDVSFDIAESQVLGIIGANGAGKSTLLKILSQITEPTEGEVRIRGRVASLLEVGTGFHPELSGRENVFMNGAILGMTQAEIRRKLDEIAAFAGVAGFLDTPVKRFSSGMLVRLGFSVAAHLDPDILVIDEVLAVGDADFQRRCLGKIDEVVRNGRTVLFVSHNLAAVQAFCSRAIVLDRGGLKCDSTTNEALALYDELLRPSGHGEALGSSAHVRSVQIRDRSTAQLGTVVLGNDLAVRIELADTTALGEFVLAVVVRDALGTRVMTSVSTHCLGRVLSRGDGLRFECVIRELCLVPGQYRATVVVQIHGRTADSVDAVFTVREANLLGTGKLPNRESGIIVPKAEWGRAS